MSATEIVLFAMVAFAAAHPRPLTHPEAPVDQLAPTLVNNIHGGLIFPSPLVVFADTVLAHSITYVNNINAYITRVSEDIKYKSPEVKTIWGDMKGNLSKVVDDMNFLMLDVSQQKAQLVMTSTRYLPMARALKQSVWQLRVKCDEVAQVLSEECEKAAQAISHGSSEAQKEVAKFTEQAVIITIDIRVDTNIMVLQYLRDRQNPALFINETAAIENIPHMHIIVNAFQALSATFVNDTISYITEVSEDMKSKSPEVKRIWGDMKGSLSKVLDDINALISNVSKQKAQLPMGTEQIVTLLQSVLQLIHKCDGLAQVLSEESRKAVQAIRQSSSKARKEDVEFAELAHLITINIRQNIFMLRIQYLGNMHKSAPFFNKAAISLYTPRAHIIANAVEAHSATFVNNITSYITQVSADIESKGPEVKRIWSDMEGNLSKVVDDMNALITNVSMQKAQLPVTIEIIMSLLQSVLQLIHKWAEVAQVLAEDSEKAAQAISRSSFEARKEVAKFTEQADIISIDIRLVIVMLQSQYFDNRWISMSAAAESMRKDSKSTDVPYIERFLREEALKQKKIM